MASEFDKQRRQLLAHISALVEHKRREINDYYSTEKLRIPKFFDYITIDQLREFGAKVDVEFLVSLSTQDHFRKLLAIKEKIREQREIKLDDVKNYFTNAKNSFPPDLLDRKVEELEEVEWHRLGIDIVKFKKKLRNVEMNADADK